MTTKGGEAKPYRGRREWRRTQLREAGAPALAAGRPQSPPIPGPRTAAKANRRIITGIASGCGRACGKPATAPSPITNCSNWFFFAQSRAAT